jgi:hypothetical protein
MFHQQSFLQPLGGRKFPVIVVLTMLGGMANFITNIPTSLTGCFGTSSIWRIFDMQIDLGTCSI